MKSRDEIIKEIMLDKNKKNYTTPTPLREGNIVSKNNKKSNNNIKPNRIYRRSN